MKIIDGRLFKEMVVTGAIVLHNNHPEIDALNVFPVPDLSLIHIDVYKRQTKWRSLCRNLCKTTSAFST